MSHEFKAIFRPVRVNTVGLREKPRHETGFFQRIALTSLLSDLFQRTALERIMLKTKAHLIDQLSKEPKLKRKDQRSKSIAIKT